jgi:DNA-binding IclR family transcriptional regulator
MTANVPSAARVLELIELIAEADHGVLLREATQRLNVPKSSTLMLLRTLVNRGYVERDPVSDRYTLSAQYQTGAFGWKTTPNGRLLAVARPIMDELMVASGETVILAGFGAQGHARALAQVVADREVRYATSLERPIPFYCSAIGRVLVSRQPEREWPRLLGEEPLTAMTRHTITDKAELLRIVGQVRNQGYCVVTEEFALGGTGVAAPVLDAEGRAVAALDIGCVTGRFDEKRERIIQAVISAANALGQALRSEPPILAKSA